MTSKSTSNNHHHPSGTGAGQSSSSFRPIIQLPSSLSSVNEANNSCISEDSMMEEMGHTATTRPRDIFRDTDGIDAIEQPNIDALACHGDQQALDFAPPPPSAQSSSSPFASPFRITRANPVVASNFVGDCRMQQNLQDDDDDTDEEGYLLYPRYYHQTTEFEEHEESHVAYSRVQLPPTSAAPAPAPPSYFPQMIQRSHTIAEGQGHSGHDDNNSGSSDGSTIDYASYFQAHDSTPTSRMTQPLGESNTSSTSTIDFRPEQLQLQSASSSSSSPSPLQYDQQHDVRSFSPSGVTEIDHYGDDDGELSFRDNAKTLTADSSTQLQPQEQPQELQQQRNPFRTRREYHDQQQQPYHQHEHHDLQHLHQPMIHSSWSSSNGRSFSSTVGATTCSGVSGSGSDLGFSWDHTSNSFDA